jgi:hypothetical protein
MKISRTNNNKDKSRTKTSNTPTVTPVTPDETTLHNIFHPSNKSMTSQLISYASNTYGILVPTEQDSAHNLYYEHFASQLPPIASAISIIDVTPDGHCGYYCLMLGLAQLNLFPSGITNVNAFRSNFVHQIRQIPHETLMQSLLETCFPIYSTNMLNDEIQNACERICDGSSWMEASIDLPLASLLFQVRIILLDITVLCKFSYVYHGGHSETVTSEVLPDIRLTQSDILQILPTILMVRIPDHFMWITTATENNSLP